MTTVMIPFFRQKLRLGEMKPLAFSVPGMLICSVHAINGKMWRPSPSSGHSMSFASQAELWVISGHWVIREIFAPLLKNNLGISVQKIIHRWTVWAFPEINANFAAIAWIFWVTMSEGCACVSAHAYGCPRLPACPPAPVCLCTYGLEVKLGHHSSSGAVPYFLKQTLSLGPLTC